MTWQIDQIGTTTAILGEGAYWSERLKSLFWVDIKGRKIYQTNPVSGEQYEWDTPSEIGFITEEPESDYFVAGFRKDIVRFRLVAGEPLTEIEILSHPEDDLPQNRFNDGCIDPFGNIWAGTMDNDEEQVSGNWWHVSKSGKTTKLKGGFKVTNGPAFSPDGKFVFLTDSAKHAIFRASYDREGNLANFELWRQFEDGDGFPDGMSFGPDGLLWIAFWDGGCVRGMDLDGNVIEEVFLPVQRPTKPVFANDHTGYVTSAKVGMQDEGVNGSVLRFERN
jgi:D-xylonolactonase